MGEWILPLQRRADSGTHQLNFLWRSDRLYVMDNHLAALWCWQQHLSESPEWQLLHIDRHYDTLRSRIDQWLELFPRSPVPLPDYLRLSQTVDGSACPVMRWDNYLSIFLARYGDRITRALFATAREGDKPQHAGLVELDPWAALDELERIGGDEDEFWDEPPWIVNVDLDYFTSRRVTGGSCRRVFDDEYVTEMGVHVADGLRRQRIRCATLALSPEMTGGWSLAETLMGTFLTSWGDLPRLPSS